MEIREQIKLVNQALSGTLDLYRIWAKRNHLNYNSLIILYTLDEYGGCTQKQICDFWALPKQTVHGVLLEFEKKGYITISSSPANKKERLVAYTDAGRTFADSVLADLHGMEERAMQRLGGERCEQLIGCTADYCRLLKEEMDHASCISQKIQP